MDFTTQQRTDATPVVCLAGLTRSAVDFTSLAQALAGDAERPRRVVAFDYRGRGLSAHDSDWRHYDLPTERSDILAGMEACGIGRAYFVGTSRGGLHAMALAPDHRTLIAAAVLNDIGPVLETAGLRRIKGYVGRMVEPRTLDEAVEILRTGAGAHFDGLSDREWRLFATTTFGETEGALRLRYDPALARTLDAFDLEQPLPESWPLYDALRDLPVLVLRGANSDLLSHATMERMAERWDGCESLTVPGQGHAPLLADDTTITRIAAFLRTADISRTSL